MTVNRDRGTRWAIDRRDCLIGAAAAVAAMGAGRRASAQDRNAPESLMRGGKVLHYRMWAAYASSDVPGLNSFLDARKGQSIEFIATPYARYRDRMITEFVAGVPLDVVAVPESELSAWAESGWLLPLDDRPELKGLLADAIPVSVEAAKGTDDKVYGLPFLAGPFGFAYDAEMLGKAGFAKPATSLDELRVQMEAVKKAGLNPQPLSLAMKRAPGQFYSLWATVFASGGSFFDADNDPVFDRSDKTLRTVLDWYVAAHNEWGIVSQADLQVDWGGSRTAMRSGVVGFGYMADFAMAEFNRADSVVRGKIRLGPVPGLNGNSGGTVGYAHSIGIAGGTKDKDAAWQVLTFMAGKDADGRYSMPKERLLVEGGRCPYKPVLDDPQVLAFLSGLHGGDLADLRRLQAGVRQRQAVKTVWFSEWEQFFMGQVQEALVKKTSVADAITASAKEARRLRTA